MATLNSVQVWKDFKREYETELKYTRKEFNDALEAQAKSLVVNRVIQSFTGRVGPDESRAMQILAVHKTEYGVVVIVK